MVSAQEQTPQRASGDTATVGRLFLLDLSDDRVVSLNSDGSDREVIVTECRYPDGIAVDVAAGHVYWTNMGHPKSNDGSVERADLDGSNVETLVDASQGDPRPGPDATKWCVGVAIDVDGGNVYWTQKGPDNRRATEGGSYRVVVSLTRTVLWLLSLGIFDKEYAAAMAGSSDEHSYVAPDLFTAETPLGTYRGMTDQVVMSRTKESYRRVLAPHGSSKPHWPVPAGPDTR
jgi:hypothetical protein